MEKNLVIVFFILLFLSCKDDKSETQTNSSKGIDSITQKTKEDDTIVDDEIINKNDTDSKEKTSFQGFELLFNHKLIGLSIINDKEEDPYKKYGLDFSTVCFCNSPSMYIDINSKKLIIFNYCDSKKTIDSIEKKTIFKITKIENEGNKISINTSNNLKLIYEKKSELPLFQIQIEGNFPNEYVGNDLKKFFTSTPEKFQEEDCGDFDG